MAHKPKILASWDSVAPTSLLGHIVGAMRKEFHTLEWEQARKEIVSGFAALLVLWISVSQGLSIKVDWDEHPWLVVFFAIVPAAWVSCDLSFRLIKALRRVYRERTHESFRNSFRLTTIMVSVALTYVLIGFLARYANSPHITMLPKTYAVGGGPDSMVTAFLDVEIVNTGIPAKAKFWRMIIKFTNGEIARSTVLLDMETTNITGYNGKQVWYHGKYLSDYRKPTELRKEDGKQRGAVGFIFKGYTKEVLNEVGNRVTLELTDEYGNIWKSKEYTVGAHFDEF